jgi:sugar phosphate isomerase/epimerase
VNRRAFLSFAAALPTKPFNRSVKQSPVPKWNLGVISDQVDFDLEFVLRSFYSKYRLRWIEIRSLKLGGEVQYVYESATPAQLKQIRSQLDRSSVRLSVLDTAIFKTTLPGTHPVGELPAYAPKHGASVKAHLEALKRAAAAVHALGGNRIRIFTFRRVARPEQVFTQVVDNLAQALEIARQEDITLLVENEYDCNTATGKEIAALFRAIPDKRLMHNWDPCNAYESGEIPYPDTWNEIAHERISHIHLKDAASKAWMPIGKGKLDFPGQFKALESISYSGTMSIETRYRDSRQDAYASTEESIRGLLHIMERSRKHL